jgi:(p)ppGpp synthase/HD superfamily hydrolase
LKLEEAVAIAARVHAGHPDKQGEMYLLHLMRVALAVSESARVVAILHDAIEDERVKEEELVSAGLDSTQLEALRLVTKSKDEKYEPYVERIARAGGEPGRIAREVKKADLRDNLDRMTDELRRHRSDLEPKYQRALDRLEEVEEGPS